MQKGRTYSFYVFWINAILFFENVEEMNSTLIKPAQPAACAPELVQKTDFDQKGISSLLNKHARALMFQLNKLSTMYFVNQVHTKA